MQKKLVKILFICILLLGGLNSACSDRGIANSTMPTQLPAMSPTAQLQNLETTPDFSCWPIRQSLKNLSGSWVYRNKNNIFAWDIHSFKVKPIENFPKGLIQSMGNAIVSNDGKTMASLTANQKMIVITQSGSEVFELPPQKYDFNHIRYLQNGKIYIPVSRDTVSNYGTPSEFTDVFYIFDPATGESLAQSIHLSDFLAIKRGVFPIEYSPDMHYVVYLTDYNQGNPQYALYDLQTSKIVWSAPKTPSDLIAAPARMPTWNPISNRLTYFFISDIAAGYGNYYEIALDGQIKQLTPFRQAIMLDMVGGWLAHPLWSPNGRYLAFRASQGISGPSKLYIWDNQKQAVFMPCLPDEEKIDQGYSIKWSFDSSYLLANLGYPNKNGQEGSPLYTHTKTVILDPLNQEIFDVPDDTHRGDFTVLYGGDANEFLGWVNWELP